jgi:hypothetical protein
VSWEWVKAHEGLLLWLGVCSLITFVATLILIPVFIVRMDRDYFVRDRAPIFAGEHPLLRGGVIAGKNLLGLFLLVIGIAMLFLPGQGLLTMLIGLGLLDFPGKRQLQARFLRIRAVQRALNWIRLKNGKESLRMP